MAQLSLKEQFKKFHAAHPEVYEEFKRRAQMLWDRGKRHYSAQGIIEILRFHSIVDGRPEDERKVNNNHAAFYSRLYTKDFPERKAFFHQREQIANRYKPGMTP